MFETKHSGLSQNREKLRTKIRYFVTRPILTVETNGGKMCYRQIASTAYPVVYGARGMPPPRLENFRASSSCSKILKDKQYFNTVKNLRASAGCSKI